MRPLLLACIACGLASATAAHADDVHLTNGRTFEGVIAELTETQVRIKLATGEMRLPRSLVARIDKVETPLQQFASRAEALRTQAASAEEWLELARWAHARGLRKGAQESALTAAELDPALPGAASLLTGLGYARDEDTGQWMAYADYMRRRGFVQYGGEWTTRTEKYQRIRSDAEERERRRQVQHQILRREEERRLAERQARLDREAALQAQQSTYIPFVVYSVPAPLVVLRHQTGGTQGPRFVPSHFAGQRQSFDTTPGPTISIYERQPGSLIPARGRF